MRIDSRVPSVSGVTRDTVPYVPQSPRVILNADVRGNIGRFPPTKTEDWGIVGPAAPATVYVPVKQPGSLESHVQAIFQLLSRLSWLSFSPSRLSEIAGACLAPIPCVTARQLPTHAALNRPSRPRPRRWDLERMILLTHFPHDGLDCIRNNRGLSPSPLFRRTMTVIE